MSQTVLATAVGVSKSAVISWEKDASSLMALALSAMSEAGADTLFVVTGRRTFLPPDSAEAQVRDPIAVIRESLLAPADPSTGTAAKSEFAILSQQLAAILRHDGNAMTPDMRKEVEQLQAIVADPARVAMFRAANCAQLRARRRELRQQLGGWLQGGSCHPSDIVVDRLATLALDCSVSLSLLAELVEEVGHDTGGRQDATEPAR